MYLAQATCTYVDLTVASFVYATSDKLTLRFCVHNSDWCRHFAGRDSLLWACYMNRTAQVKKLIKYAVGNLNFSTQDKQGNCGLHFAVKHNNVALLKILLTNCEKFGLPLDVPDNNGLTPLLHAKHMGYDEVVQVLVSAGASDQRADDVTLSNAQEWKSAGKLMRTIEKTKRKENHYVYGKRLALNVVPQIDPRGLYRTKTTLWNRSQTKHVTLQAPTLHQKSYSLPSNYRRNSIEKLRSILKYRPDEKTLLVDAHDSEDEELSVFTTPDLSSRRQQHSDKAIVTSINQIMTLLSDQICGSYREPALDTIKETMQKQKKTRRGTTLTRINNRVKAKTDEQEKKMKLRKELERQTKMLKHRESVAHEKHAKPEPVKAAEKASREPSKVGLLR